MSVNITPRRHADTCIDYYQRQDVELEGAPEYSPVWGGKGLDHLGVHRGSLNQRSFNRLAHNKHPMTNRQLTARMRADRVVLTDVTLAGPKSVSVAAALSPQGHKVVAAFHAAGDRLMNEDMPKHAYVRERKGGAYRDRQTEAVLWRRNTHLLARPVESKPPDPQLHSHYTVFNAAYDQAEHDWKALKTHHVMRHRSELQKKHLQYLREELHARGIQTRDTKGGWELKSIPDSLIKKFSSRRGFIVAWAEKAGALGDGRRMRLAGLFGRKAKGEAKDYQELKDGWLAAMTEKEKRAVASVWANPKTIAVRRQMERSKSRLAGLRRSVTMRPDVSMEVNYER
jgi:conjugative relaxase-like TrwC/TraI family protein